MRHSPHRTTQRRAAFWSVVISLGLLVLPAKGGTLEDQQAATVSCVSVAGERQHCPADTSAGVLLARSTGPAACLLGKTWGYDDDGIWVMEGCGGEFLVARTAPEAAPEPPPEPPIEKPPLTAEPPSPLTSEEEEVEIEEKGEETWGFLDPGKGISLLKGDAGELSLSAYVLLRYLNQTPADQTFEDHLGREHIVDTRNYISIHRVLIWLKGWMGTPKLEYQIILWTVTDTDQDALFGNLGYLFNKKFRLFAGIYGNPGSRSLLGSHPYWLGHDRVMADEFFRPYFTQGVWANGEIAPGLWYMVSAGNNLSALGITASQLDRKLTYGGSVWWMPTTKEFGPRGAYGDFEMHDKLATRFGISSTFSPEERHSGIGTAPANTVLRLADSLNVFEIGALAEGVTVTNVDYQVLAIDAGFKYRGFFFQTEYYWRTLDSFVADGPLPVERIEDHGFYVQTAFYPIPRTLELYALTSQIFADEDAGFRDSSEYGFGLNYYIVENRNYRVNAQVLDVNHSPVSSSFGYYIGGLDGTVYSLAASVFF